MRNDIRIALLIVLLVTGATAHAADTEPLKRFNQLYGDILANYWHGTVHIHGIDTTVFDYAAMARDARRQGSAFHKAEQALNELVNPPSQGDAGKAFWINAYNFGAIRLIVEHYPVDSIRSFKISLLRHPWSKDAVRIGGRWYSLSEIEHDILIERFGDPRIVFAVSCAAVSCPDRGKQPFNAATLDRQLDANIRRFFRNPGKGLRLDKDAGMLMLSWILKKDRHLFEDKYDGVLNFVLRYADDATRDRLQAHDVDIDYLDHDWTLNDVAQAKGG